MAVVQMMARYAIYLTFDAKAEQTLQRLREKLAAEIPSLPSVTGKMAPHLTLLVFAADPAGPNAENTFKEVIKEIKGFSIALDSIDAFSGRRSVLYVKPMLSSELQAGYMRCFHCFSSSDIVTHYRDPADWHPHVTLAKNIDRQALRQARTIAEREWTPMIAQTRSIGLINVQKPLEVLASKTLDY